MGLEIPSVGVWSLWQNNLVSDSERRPRQRALAALHREADRSCVPSGGKNDSGCSRLCRLRFCRAPEKIRLRIPPIERAQDADCRRLAPEAKAADVAIGIENVWNRFLLSHWKLGGSWMRSAPTMSVCLWMSVMPCISATRNNGSRSSVTASKSYICLTIALIRQALALS